MKEMTENKYSSDNRDRNIHNSSKKKEDTKDDNEREEVIDVIKNRVGMMVGMAIIQQNYLFWIEILVKLQ